MFFLAVDTEAPEGRAPAHPVRRVLRLRRPSYSGAQRITNRANHT